MPRGDGSGPPGSSKGTGFGIRGGRLGGSTSAGPEGYCICPKCGTKVKHNRAQPCAGLQCPQCGSAMNRD